MPSNPHPKAKNDPRQKGEEVNTNPGAHVPVSQEEIERGKRRLRARVRGRRRRCRSPRTPSAPPPPERRRCRSRLGRVPRCRSRLGRAPRCRSRRRRAHPPSSTAAARRGAPPPRRRLTTAPPPWRRGGTAPPLNRAIAEELYQQVDEMLRSARLKKKEVPSKNLRRKKTWLDKLLKGKHRVSKGSTKQGEKPQKKKDGVQKKENDGVQPQVEVEKYDNNKEVNLVLQECNNITSFTQLLTANLDNLF
nr:uncharacterized protein LOC127294238 [Lolium perenne]XP_051179987.1 uncharacterized protein LOC127294246 [Lolium perenne]